MKGRHDHERELDCQEDRDNHDQHQGCVVGVSLSLVLPGDGEIHDDEDGSNDDDENGGDVDDHNVMFLVATHLPPVRGFAAWSALLAIKR